MENGPRKGHYEYLEFEGQPTYVFKLADGYSLTSDSTTSYYCEDEWASGLTPEKDLYLILCLNRGKVLPPIAHMRIRLPGGTITHYVVDIEDIYRYPTLFLTEHVRDLLGLNVDHALYEREYS